jgi:hypothetical protein
MGKWTIFLHIYLHAPLMTHGSPGDRFTPLIAHLFCCFPWWLLCTWWDLCRTMLSLILCPTFLFNWDSFPHCTFCCLIFLASNITSCLLCGDCSTLHMSLYCWHRSWNIWYFPLLIPLLYLHVDVLHCHTVLQLQPLLSWIPLFM